MLTEVVTELLDSLRRRHGDSIGVEAGLEPATSWLTAAFPRKLRRTQKSYDREPRMTVGETLRFHYKTVARCVTRRGRW